MIYALDSISRNIIFASSFNENDRNTKIVICPNGECNEKLSYCKESIDHRRPHFRHLPNSNCVFKERESFVHDKCIYFLENILINFNTKFIRNCKNCNQENIYNIQKTIKKNIEIEKYHQFDNKSIRYDLVLLNDNGTIQYGFEVLNTHKTNEDNRPNDIPWFEISVEDISKIIISIENQNNYPEVIIFNCKRDYLCFECVSSKGFILNKNLVNDPKIYYVQMGAGNGKTYRNIQLINDSKFFNKKYFIYLTKTHSAKTVINNELQEQIGDGKLENIPKLKLSEEEKEYRSKNININTQNIDLENERQYIINFFDKNKNKNCEIIIATIDSFMYSLDNFENIKGFNIFEEILKSIINGSLNDKNKLIYKKVILNNEVLILIDEAQDLSLYYKHAIEKIISKTKVDLCITGDKLQSIYFIKNLMTEIENDETLYVIKEFCQNRILRFHNKNFINFINNIIDFEKYNLPKVEGVCNLPKCKYDHNDDEIPYFILNMPNLFDIENNDIEHDKSLECLKFFDNVIKKMDYLIERKNYLPNNFIVISPLVNKIDYINIFCNMLNEFWNQKFEDINYTNKFDKSILDNFIKNRYVVLHKSEGGQSINLDSSKYATRIVSIHSSKGDGREVSIVLGLTEKTLKYFNCYTDDLVYNSLFHVAMTRQKEYLIFGLNENMDDINKRFNRIEKINIERDPNITINLKDINISLSFKDLITYIKNHAIYNDDILNKYIDDAINILELDNKLNPILDFGHHVLRKCIDNFYIFQNIYNEYENSTIIGNPQKHQFITILNKISESKIKIMNNYEYSQFIYSKNKYDKILPVLIYGIFNNIHDINKNINHNPIIFIKILKILMKKLKNKLSKSELPNLCPLEILILYHYIGIRKINSTKIYINDIYDIIESFKVFKEIDQNHQEYECACKNSFNYTINNELDKFKNKYQKSLYAHYNIIQKRKIDMEKFNNYYKEHSIKYNTCHNIKPFYYNDNIFDLNKTIDIIGYDDKNVLLFKLTPNINILNCRKKLIKIFFENLFIKRVENSDNNDNYKKFNGKSITTCIFTLCNNHPQFIKIYDIINIDNKNLEKIVKEYIYESLNELNKYIYDRYIYLRGKDENINKNIIRILRDEIIEDDKKYKKLFNKEKYPPYIKDFFKESCINFDKGGNKKLSIEKIFENRESFMEIMEEKLQDEINEYIDEKIYELEESV